VRQEHTVAAPGFAATLGLQSLGRIRGSDDAERLSKDPTFRLIGSEKIWDRVAALPSRLHWFETEVLSQDENLEGLSRINRELRAKVEALKQLKNQDHTVPPITTEGRKNRWQTKVR
jgi:hypothetical protein